MDGEYSVDEIEASLQEVLLKKSKLLYDKMKEKENKNNKEEILNKKK